MTNEYKVSKAAENVDWESVQKKYSEILDGYKDELEKAVAQERFRRLHDQWNRIVLKTLHFWKRIQNDPVLTTNSTGAVQTKGVTASKPMRLQMKPRLCKQCRTVSAH